MPGQTLADLRAETGGDIKPPPSVVADASAQQASGPYFHYCLDQNHGSGASLIDMTRIFSTPHNDGCPTCPGCPPDELGRPRQVSALPMVDKLTLPELIQDLAVRQGLARIVLKEG